MKTVTKNIEISKAIQKGFAYCQRRDCLVQALYHKKQDLLSGIPALECCTMTGYCYPCFVEGIQHRAIYPGRHPPEITSIECTRNLHNYAYYVYLTDDYFLKNKTPDEVPESLWAALEKVVPEHEKGEPMIFIRP